MLSVSGSLRESEHGRARAPRQGLGTLLGGNGGKVDRGETVFREAKISHMGLCYNHDNTHQRYERIS
eukprot:scaffold69_cov248-Pinguiococcus_pyrenoidosus.AAC.41